MRALRLAGVLLAAGAVLGGCGLSAGSVTAPEGPGSCANMPEGACQEQIDRAADGSQALALLLMAPEFQRR